MNILPFYTHMEKYILRKAIRKILPRKVFNRRKQRFFTPIDSWFDKGIRDYCEGLLSDKEVSSYFNPDFIKRLLNYKHFSEYNRLLKYNSKSRLFYSRKLWNILMFGLWHKAYIEEENIKTL